MGRTVIKILLLVSCQVLLLVLGWNGGSSQKVVIAFSFETFSRERIYAYLDVYLVQGKFEIGIGKCERDKVLITSSPISILGIGLDGGESDSHDNQRQSNPTPSQTLLLSPSESGLLRTLSQNIDPNPNHTSFYSYFSFNSTPVLAFH